MPLLFLDLAQKAPLCNDQPANIRARIVERDRKSGLHPAVHMLDGAALAHGPSGSPAGLLTRWTAWSDNGGDLEAVFTKDDLLIHATIYWATNSIATSMRYNVNVNANRYVWAPSHDRTPALRAPVGLTFVSYEDLPGIYTFDERVHAFTTGAQSALFNHVNVNAHGGHSTPWENPDAWVDDLRRTLHNRRPDPTRGPIRRQHPRTHAHGTTDLGSETEDSLPLRTTPP